MVLKKYIISLYIFLFAGIASYSQKFKLPAYKIETGSVTSAGKQTPFWLYSNQNGLILSDKFNFYLKAGINSILSTEKKIDYAYGLEFANRYADKNEFYVTQAYIQIKWNIFQFSGGNFYSVYGNQYEPLSSGGLVWSGNARTFPRINLEVPTYSRVPLTNGIVEFMGGISHGWLGNNDSVKNLWLHHKYFFLRFGGKSPLNFHMGLHHFAQWGGTTRYGKMPSDFAAFKKIFFVQAGDKDNSQAEAEWVNKLGNHIGSFNLGLDVSLSNYKTGIYWQTIFEDQSGMKFKNLRDGLWGVFIHSKDKNHLISGILYEFVNTSHQSGVKFMSDSVKVEGNDNYFNHGVYFTGWSFKDQTIGTPFITSPMVLHGTGKDYFRNNKIRAHHVGVEGSYSRLYYKILYSYVVNSGTNRFPFSNDKTNHSLLFKTVISGITSLKVDLGFSVGADLGTMYGRNAGIMVSIIKNGNF